jgi:uncharacterized membrane protein HdeD (DUF308 family)
MIRDLVANWWLLRARGILALAFGAFLVFLAGTMEGAFSTAIALVAVRMIFVLYLLVSGLLSMIAAAKLYGKPHRSYNLAVHGTLLLLLGIGLFFLTERLFFGYFGSWLLLRWLLEFWRSHLGTACTGTWTRTCCGQQERFP